MPPQEKKQIINELRLTNISNVMSKDHQFIN